MISMKLTPAEAKAETFLGEQDELPEYPYGLTICIDDDMLAKLGITDLPPVGTKFRIEALAEVCSTSQYANQSGADQSMSLQITDMELAAGNTEIKPDIANRIYGG
jgi:hypothetical protein